MPRRSIDTKMWSDNWFISLDPTERYLWQYLMTNEHTELCGIYELPLRIMAFESGLDIEMLNKIILRFSADKKAFYYEGWVYLINYESYQIMNSSMKVNSIRSKNRIPKNILSYFQTLKIESGDTVSTQRRHIKDKDKDKDNKGGSGGELKKHLDYLKDIPENDLEEFSEKFNCSSDQIKDKADDLFNYCEAKGKRYKNYKAFLRNAVKKDFGIRTAPPKKLQYEEVINKKGEKVMRQVIEK